MSTGRTSFTRIWCLVAILSCTVIVYGSAGAEQACRFVTQRVQCGDLACDKERNICIPCRTTEDCYPEAMDCNKESGKCVVRSFFSLFGLRIVLSMIASVAICSIGVIAGVGGGGMLVPMFTALIQIPMQSAVGLSQSTICGQSTLNVYLSVQKKFPHPTSVRPLINYQYLGLLLPLGLIGTLIGGVFSKLCPDILRLILLFALLSAVLYRTIGKMKRQYAEDREQRQANVSAAPCEPSAPSMKSETQAESHADPAILVQPQYPTFELVLVFVCFFVLLLFNIIRTVTICGGFWYWICILCPLVLLGCAFYYHRSRLAVMAEECPGGLTFTWNAKTSVYFPMVAVVAGAAAAMLGIGGGLVLGFVLYEVGLIPEEASVTGGMATFFIAFSSALQLLVTGHLVLDFGIVFFVVGGASTALGQFVFMKYIQDHGLRFLIVGSLAFTVGGSLLVLGGYGIYNAVDASRQGGSLVAFGRLCSG